MSDFKEAVGTCSLGVDHSLRNSFSVELSELIDQSEVLKEKGASRTSCHRVLVVVNGRAS
jgi:hypothetical protein